MQHFSVNKITVLIKSQIDHVNGWILPFHEVGNGEGKPPGSREIWVAIQQGPTFRTFRYNSLRSDKPETVPMDIYDLDGRIGFQVFPQPGNKNIHTAAVKIVVGSPDLFKGIFSREDAFPGIV